MSALARSLPQVLARSANAKAFVVREVGVGLLSVEDYDELAAYFCDADGDAGLCSTLGSELSRLADAAEVAERGNATSEEQSVLVHGQPRAAIELDDDRMFENARRWRHVEARLARMAPEHARVLEVAFTWLRSCPLDRRQRLRGAFGGVAPLVVASVGLADAELTARVSAAATQGEGLDPMLRWVLKRRASAMRARMEKVMAGAEGAWLASVH